MNCKMSMFILQQIRSISTRECLRNTHKNHYDSLGIEKSATQADVKTAYYKLSKIYHPDTNKGKEDQLQKFRDITEAYEILGNVKTRKMYDKGFHMGHVHQGPSPDDPLHKFYKSRDTRSQPPPPSGRTPIYDFDSWAKAHYGDTFRRSQDFKQRFDKRNRLWEEHQNDKKHEKVFLVCLIFIFLCTYVMRTSQSYDVVSIPVNIPIFPPPEDPKNGKS